MKAKAKYVWRVELRFKRCGEIEQHWYNEYFATKRDALLYISGFKRNYDFCCGGVRYQNSVNIIGEPRRIKLRTTWEGR